MTCNWWPPVQPWPSSPQLVDAKQRSRWCLLSGQLGHQQEVPSGETMCGWLSSSTSTIQNHLVGQRSIYESARVENCHVGQHQSKPNSEIHGKCYSPNNWQLWNYMCMPLHARKLIKQRRSPVCAQTEVWITHQFKLVYTWKVDRHMNKKHIHIVYIYICVCMYICIYIYTHIYIHIQIYKYIYIYMQMACAHVHIDRPHFVLAEET